MRDLNSSTEQNLSNQDSQYHTRRKKLALKPTIEQLMIIESFLLSKWIVLKQAQEVLNPNTKGKQNKATLKSLQDWTSRKL